MRKDEYAERRDLEHTPEPGHGSGGNLPESPVFVIQQHQAEAMHWDFRIEIDGVLASWAVPKGPSTDPGEKRLAVRTEDHPLDYADFEGLIPEGEYGAGPVILWDRGTYRNLLEEKEDPQSMSEALDEGQIEVWLEGHKVTGGYALVHARVGGDDDNWLLVKMDDEEADARRNPTSTEPESVTSGRTIDEVRQQEAERAADGDSDA